MALNYPLMFAHELPVDVFSLIPRSLWKNDRKGNTYKQGSDFSSSILRHTRYICDQTINSYLLARNVDSVDSLWVPSPVQYPVDLVS